jgi:hypothetical protein
MLDGSLTFNEIDTHLSMYVEYVRKKCVCCETSSKEAMVEVSEYLYCIPPRHQGVCDMQP